MFSVATQIKRNSLILRSVFTNGSSIPHIPEDSKVLDPQREQQQRLIINPCCHNDRVCSWSALHMWSSYAPPSFVGERARSLCPLECTWRWSLSPAHWSNQEHMPFPLLLHILYRHISFSPMSSHWLKVDASATVVGRTYKVKAAQVPESPLSRFEVTASWARLRLKEKEPLAESNHWQRKEVC